MLHTWKCTTNLLHAAQHTHVHDCNFALHTARSSSSSSMINLKKNDSIIWYIIWYIMRNRITAYTSTLHSWYIWYYDTSDSVTHLGCCSSCNKTWRPILCYTWCDKWYRGAWYSWYICYYDTSESVTHRNTILVAPFSVTMRESHLPTTYAATYIVSCILDTYSIPGCYVRIHNPWGISCRPRNGHTLCDHQPQC